MADIVFLTTIVAFFLLCAGYVWACGRIIGDQTYIDLDEHSRDDAVDATPPAPAERAA